MDETPRIPYYFPPQRYIPRLGGGNESPQTGASGFFKGLSDAFELYLQLQQAKEGKAERESARKERETDRDETRQFRQSQQDLAKQEQTSRAQALQQERENQQLQYGQRAGITLDPGMVRHAMEAPVAPKTVGDFGAPTAEGVSRVVQGFRPQQEEGLSGMFQRGGTALRQSYQTGLPETFEGGFATRPASEERYNYRESESADRRKETELRVAREALHDWYTSRASYAGQQIQEFRAKNPFVIPGGKEEDPIIDRAFQDYAKLHPMPTFGPDVERNLGRNPVPLPLGENPSNPNPAPKPTGNTVQGVDPRNADAFTRQLQNLTRPR